VFISGGFWNRLRRIPVMFAAVILVAVPAQASVTLNLGQTAENFVMVGGGPNSSGLGTYSITQGACTTSEGSTTCTLSGSFTGSTPQFASGTYTFVTVYPGSGTGASSPFKGVQRAAGSNLFQFSSVPSGATMTLNLTTASGTFVVPIFGGGQFAVQYGFVYNANAVCSGTPVSTCAVGPVGSASGAVMTGPVTGALTFDSASSNYYYAQIAFQGGYQTTLTFVNYSTAAVTCVTNFYGDSGGPLAVPFAQGNVTSRTDVLQSGQSIHDQTVANLSAPNAQGWGVSTCTGPVAASVLYRNFVNSAAPGQAGVSVAQSEAGVNGEAVPTTKFATFAQTATGVAYANPSATQSATVTIEAINSAGTPLGSTTLTLGPLAHGAAILGQLLNLQSFTGWVKITSTSPIISLSLNFEAFPAFSSLPPGDLPSTTTLAP
jgi:hypothetical protein